jgi:hypothetical protein
MAVASAAMAEREFSVTYQGTALAEGRMRVSDLAPALLATGALLKSANRILNPGSDDIALEVRANPERGSFIVHLILSNPDFNDEILRFLASPEGDALANLTTLVTGIFGTAGIMRFLSNLHGRSVMAEERPVPGTMRLVLEDEQVIETSEDSWALYQSIEVRESIDRVVEPLRNDGIDELVIDAIENEELRISRDEVGVFEPPSRVEQEVLTDNREEVLQIIAPNFGERMWKFTDGANTILASIQDRDFNDRVVRGEEAFKYGDALRCRVSFRQYYSEDGNLRTSRVITRVIEHLPRRAVVQRSILDDQDSD